MATKKNRIMITVTDENLRRLEWISNEHGINKSAQIQTLIMKYLETEYGKIPEGEKDEK